MVNGSKNLVYLFHRIQLSKKRNELLIYPITCMNLLRVTLCEKASTERLHATSVRCSVVKSCLTFCDPMDCRPPRACSNSCPLSRWCHPTISSSVTPPLLLPSIFPSIRVSFRMDWLDLAIQGILKSLLQHHISKASVLRRSTFYWTHYAPLSKWYIDRNGEQTTRVRKRLGFERSVWVWRWLRMFWTHDYILAVKRHCGLIRCFHRGNSVNSTEISELFPTTACESTIMSNFKDFFHFKKVLKGR